MPKHIDGASILHEHHLFSSTYHHFNLLSALVALKLHYTSYIVLPHGVLKLHYVNWEIIRQDYH